MWTETSENTLTFSRQEYKSVCSRIMRPTLPIHKLAQDDHKGWLRTANSITPGCSQSISSADRHYVDGSWYTSKKLANKLNEHFFKVGGIPERSGVQLPDSLPPQPVSLGEIKTALRGIKTSKATHPDDYPSWTSQRFAADLCLPTTDIINTILMSWIFVRPMGGIHHQAAPQNPSTQHLPRLPANLSTTSPQQSS